MGKEGISTVAFCQHQEPWGWFSRLQVNTQQGGKMPLARVLLSWVWRLYFPSYPFLKGFFGSIYYSERFESVVLVVRLLSKFLAFLEETQGKRPLKQNRPSPRRNPGQKALEAEQTFQSAWFSSGSARPRWGVRWGRVHMIILVSVSRKSTWMCWFHLLSF